MRPALPPDVIAERHLRLELPDGHAHDVIVRFGQPRPDPAPGGAWLCHMEILGLPGGDLGRDVAGEDSLQALVLALELVALDLPHHTPPGANLSWSGDPDLQLLPRNWPG